MGFARHGYTVASTVKDKTGKMVIKTNVCKMWRNVIYVTSMRVWIKNIRFVVCVKPGIIAVLNAKGRIGQTGTSKNAGWYNIISLNEKRNL